MGTIAGISTRSARQVLARVVEESLKASFRDAPPPSLQRLWRKDLVGGTAQLCLNACIWLLLAGCIYGTVAGQSYVEYLVMVFLVASLMLANALVKAVYERCNALELRHRLLSARGAFVKAASLAEGSFTNERGKLRSTPKASWASGLVPGGTAQSVFSVYRDGCWQRVPRLLLVQGDIIALMGGDTAPAAVQLLQFDARTKDMLLNCAKEEAQQETGPCHPDNLQWEAVGSTIVAANERIQLRAEAVDRFDKRAMLAPNSPLLLLLCGDIRCYELLATPLQQHLTRFLPLSESHPSQPPPPSLLWRRLVGAQQTVLRAMQIMTIATCLAGCVRVAVRGEAKGWVADVIILPVAVAICLLPLTSPLLMVVGESLSTARLLAVVELVLCQKRSKLSSAPNDSGDASRTSSRHGPFAREADNPAAPDSPLSLSDADDFDEFDADERQALLSQARHVVPRQRIWGYFVATWRTRWRIGMMDVSTLGSGGTTPPAEGHLAGLMRACGLAGSASAAPLLPIPMLQSQLVEKIGAVTMTIMLDEESVCESYSSAEEIFLANSKDDVGIGHGSVLDLHAKVEERGLGFEDPNWWIHLPSLKPLGLACLLSEPLALSVSPTHGRAGGALQRESVESATTSSSQSAESKRPDEALVDHVRQPVPLEHLTQNMLWKAIGFSEQDRATFKERRQIHVISPRLAAHRATDDLHAQGQAEARRRGSMRPHVTGLVVEDRKSKALQLLSQGYPSIVLSMCPDYWDGSTISPMPMTLRRKILDMHTQWALEDLDVVAFSYSPVPYTVQSHLATPSKAPDYLVYSKHGHEDRGAAGGAGVGTVKVRKSLHGRDLPSTSDKFESRGTPSTRGGRKSASKAGLPDKVRRSAATATSLVPSDADTGAYNSSSHSLTTDKVVVSSIGSGFPSEGYEGDDENVWGARKQGGMGMVSEAEEQGAGRGEHDSGAGSDEHSGGTQEGHQRSRVESAAAAVVDRPANEGEQLFPLRGNPLSQDTVVTSASLHGAGRRRLTTGGSPAPLSDDFATGRKGNARGRTHQAGTNESPHQKALWTLMHDQVFLGMIASSVPPKRGIAAFIEDLMASGTRFVYFSPRNMRRSKALAEDMGIETDWNCAISLRELDEPDTPDPHRIITDYADWDVKARLPHGVRAIKDHILKVDNVPLLVSLFTDATADTTEAMLRIFQEHDECVLVVGTSYRAPNAYLFGAADIAFSQMGLPSNQPFSSLPATPHSSRISADDIVFNNNLVGIHASLPLGDPYRPGAAMEGVHEVIIEMLKEGRRLLCNVYQAMAFNLVASFSQALLLLCSALLPVSRPMLPNGSSVMWLLCVVYPIISIGLLAAPSAGDLMRRAPEKNSAKAVPVALRHIVYLLTRTMPTVLGCLVLYLYLFGALLISRDRELASSCAGGNDGVKWTDTLWCEALAKQPMHPSVSKALSVSSDVVFTELVLCLVVQSAGFMYRTSSMMKEQPWRNRIWLWCCLLVLALQVTFLWVAASIRGATSLLLSVPWTALVAGLAWPLAVLGVGEAVKRHDHQLHERYLLLLRLEFDTRLGMYSPR